MCTRGGKQGLCSPGWGDRRRSMPTPGRAEGRGGGPLWGVAGGEAPQVESDLEPLVEEHSTVVEEREEVGERETKWTD